ncbi:MAG: lactate dehydrogenase, partial [Acetobacter sp.]
AMSGDRSIRRVEDLDSDGNQFAMAKALASGDMRLMQKAGLEAELARLERLYAAHYDDQFAVRRAVQQAEREIAWAQARIPLIEADLAARVATRGESFSFETERGVVTEREKAGAFLLAQLRLAVRNGQEGRWTLGRIGGFVVTLDAVNRQRFTEDKVVTDAGLSVAFAHGTVDITVDQDTKPLGLVARIENLVLRLDGELADAQKTRDEAARRLPAYQARLGVPFRDQALLDEKRNALAELEADLAATSREGEEEAPANDDIPPITEEDDAPNALRDAA